MGTTALPADPEWLVKSRKAACFPRRRLNEADLSLQDMEDMIQAANPDYWKHHRKGRPICVCLVCARQAAEKYLYRRIQGRSSRNLPSLWMLP